MQLCEVENWCFLGGSRWPGSAVTHAFAVATAPSCTLSRPLGVCRCAFGSPRMPQTGQEDPKRPPKTVEESL
eukprot:5014148-Pyramimonas_sp.AAC.1